MLGYGNLAALVNDPRVNPRAWDEANDIEAEGAAAAANCAVRPIGSHLQCASAAALARPREI